MNDNIPTLPGITSTIVETPRLRTHVLACGPSDGAAIVFIHGNFSAATYWEELMLTLGERGFRCIAPDLRGYGWSEDKRTDATRGLRDYADDVHALAEALSLPPFHIVGWSLGGGVAMRYAIDHPEQLLSLTLQAPVSPYGFGGTKGLDGQPCYDDCAGSGGGVVNPEFVQLIAKGDRSADSANSPRNVISAFYYKPPFKAAREEDFLTAALQERTGSDRYPGDFVPSANWPNVAPGVWGPINAGAPKYVAGDADAFVGISPKPPVLWMRGDSDMIVGDASFFDIGLLGKLGYVPGYPGEDVFPPQPMVGQTRAVLQRYAEAGGQVREVVLPDCAHAPHIEKPEAWLDAFMEIAK